MGNIHENVNHLFHGLALSEQTMLRAFLHSFSISWIRRYELYGTSSIAVVLKPDKHFADGTNYLDEILCVYSPFSSVEARSLRLLYEISKDPEIASRLDPFAVFFVSDAVNVKDRVDDLVTDHFRTQVVVAISSSDLIRCKDDPWFVRKCFMDRVCGRDLFDIRLPIEDDLNFFGRKDLINSIVDTIKKGQNIGVFGLRKTGKTSVLLRAKKTCTDQDLALPIYIDCKSPEVWGMSWVDLLLKISSQILPATESMAPRSDHEKISSLRRSVVERNRRIVLIFDEIEFISPTSKLAPQWKSDFVPFWQLIWSIQSETRSLSVIIAGVDPSVAENPVIQKVQNPLFSIVKLEFVRGLIEEDLRGMVRVLGRKIGLVIDYTPAMWFFARYGGHPLLTRLACSVVHRLLLDRKEDRPYQVDEAFLELYKEIVDAEVSYYAEHVMISLREFFPAEARLLEMLAIGREVDFFDQAKNLAAIRHLVSYGVLVRESDGKCRIRIAPINDYLRHDLGLKEKIVGGIWIVPKRQRFDWLSGRLYRVLKDCRHLDKLLKAIGKDLFGPVTFPESEGFLNSKPATSELELQGFLNTANKTLVESLSAYGQSKGYKNYFWDNVKPVIPDLWDGLNRIRVYRNNEFHLVLREKVYGELATYLRRDLGVGPYTLDSELYFVIQQRVLDAIQHGLQLEISRLEA